MSIFSLPPKWKKNINTKTKASPKGAGCDGAVVKSSSKSSLATGGK